MELPHSSELLGNMATEEPGPPRSALEQRAPLLAQRADWIKDDPCGEQANEEEELLSLAKISSKAKQWAAELAACHAVDGVGNSSTDAPSSLSRALPASLPSITEEAQAGEEPLADAAMQHARDIEALGGRLSPSVKQSLQFSMSLAEMLAMLVDHMDAVRAQVSVCLAETSRLGQIVEANAADGVYEAASDSQPEHEQDLRRKVLQTHSSQTTNGEAGSAGSPPFPLESTLGTAASSATVPVAGHGDDMLKNVVEAAKIELAKLMQEAMVDFQDNTVTALREKLDTLPLGVLCNRVTVLEQQLGVGHGIASTATNPSDHKAIARQPRTAPAYSFAAVQQAVPIAARSPSPSGVAAERSPRRAAVIPADRSPRQGFCDRSAAAPGELSPPEITSLGGVINPAPSAVAGPLSLTASKSLGSLGGVAISAPPVAEAGRTAAASSHVLSKSMSARASLSGQARQVGTAVQASPASDATAQWMAARSSPRPRARISK